MTKRMYLVLIASLLILAYSCKKEKKDDKGYTYHKVVPAEFPNLDIPGFSFPQDSVTLNQWIHNSEEYCGKLLFFNQGKRCSWHYHKLKDEVFYLQSGKYGKTNCCRIDFRSVEC